jgi:predicted GNAT family acetyltransferase
MMLESYPFVGVWEDGRLVASAGTHVASRDYGVAAVGAVITRPSHRGRGLGARVMAAICRQLAGDYPLIGLNVEVANEPALRLYDRLGFRRAFQYEEIEVL